MREQKSYSSQRTPQPRGTAMSVQRVSLLHFLFLTHFPASQTLEVVYMDLCGPIQSQSLLGARYFLIIINQFTGYVMIKFLRNKSDAFGAFKDYKARSENLQGRKILKIVSDGVKEFCNCQFKQLARESGFENYIIPPYTLD
ncbi:hypothetical protein O181_031336 [Austropuccinia psidii MF-1]|uniref:Integrase catalytic domain-containing protein n=1 Tax=Austropuccinia psidii MF-1 TaxID=1389203 RepID=A0A9Q3H536_9BASI|nr:hypothetical protein [Austropuccinia psidii MF-1]